MVQLEAMRNIGAWLPVAVRDGSSLEALGELQVACGVDGMRMSDYGFAGTREGGAPPGARRPRDHGPSLRGGPGTHHGRGHCGHLPQELPPGVGQTPAANCHQSSSGDAAVGRGSFRGAPRGGAEVTVPALS